jgi:nitrile hydratase
MSTIKHPNAERLQQRSAVGNKSWQAIRTEAVESLLHEIGVIDSSDVDEIVHHYEEKVGPKTGARIILKAWTDPGYKARLLSNGKSAIQEIGISVGEAQIVVVENTPTVHNLITCTLCSCYPRSILGQPPSWYISKDYRARTVREPRKVLEEFGVTLSKEIQLIVHDSNADMRYLVLPEPPANLSAMDATKLEATIGRDDLIGVSR